MAEVGVLNLTIHDNSETAAGGLDKLAKKLSAVKDAASGFTLGAVAGAVKAVQEAVEDNETIKQLANLFGALSSFGKLKNFSIDTKQFSELRESLSGMTIGNTGTQLKNIREALGGDWHTENLADMMSTMNAVHSAAAGWQASGVAKTFNEVAKAIGNYNRSVRDMPEGGPLQSVIAVLHTDVASIEKDAQKVKTEFGDVLRDIFAKSRDVGGNASAGTAQGVESRISDVISASKKVADAIPETTRERLDEHSPSKVMEEIGEYAGEGFVKGYESKLSDVKRVANEMAQAAIPQDVPMLEKISSETQSAITHVGDLRQKIQDLLYTLRNPSNDSYKGFRNVVDIATGVERNNTNLAEEAAKSFNDQFFANLDTRTNIVDHLLEKLNNPTNSGEWNSKFFDQAMGIKDQIENVISAETSAFNNIPAMDKNGTFEYANEELTHYAGLLRDAQQAMDDYAREHARISKQIKYNGATEERTQALERMSKSFYTAAENEETYKNKVAEVTAYMNEYISAREKMNSEAVSGTSNAIMGTTNAAKETTAEIWQWGQAFDNSAFHAKKMADMAEADARRIKLSREMFANARDDVKNYIAELQGMSKEELFSGSDGITQSGTAMDTVREKTEEYKRTVEQTTPSVRRLKSEMLDMSSTGNTVKAETERMHAGFKDLKKGIEKMFPSLARLRTQFSSIARRMFLRSIIKQITAGFREGVENVYNYSKAVGTSFAPSMDRAASSLLQMKNSIGAAVAPAIQALIPILERVTSWFIELVNYVNQFFALLNGQNTWTRALATSTEAYADSTKKAAGAAKDWLADFDELNVMAQDNGSSGASKTADDYSKMFEEVTEFDGKVKELVEWIQGHMETVCALAIATGAAILGWKISKAFEGALGTIGDLILGGALVTIGLELSYAAGFQAGLEGEFDTESILTAIGGAVSSAIGGAIIGFQMGGTWGAIVGGVTGLVASIAVTFKGYLDGERQRKQAARWGKVHLTDEQIKDLVDTQMTAKVKTWIEVASVSIKNRAAAKNKANYAISKFSTDLETAKFLLDVDAGKEAMNKAKESAKAAIDAINNYLSESQEGIKLSFTKFTYKDSQGKDITSDLYANLAQGTTALQGFFNDIGNDIAKYISEGYQKGIDSEEWIMGMKLMDTFERIANNAESNYRRSKLVRDAQEGMSKLNDQWDQETANKVMEEQNASLLEYKDTVIGQWKEDVEYYDRYIKYAEEAVKYFEEMGNNEKAEEFKGYIAEAQTALNNTQAWVRRAQNGTYNWMQEDETYKEIVNTMRDEWIKKIKEWYGDVEAEAFLGKTISEFGSSTLTGVINPVLQGIGRMFGIDSYDLFTAEEMKKFTDQAFEDAEKKAKDNPEKDVMEYFKEILEDRGLPMDRATLSSYSTTEGLSNENADKLKKALFDYMVENGVFAFEEFPYAKLAGPESSSSYQYEVETLNGAYDELARLYNYLTEDMMNGVPIDEMRRRYEYALEYVDAFIEANKDKFGLPTQSAGAEEQPAEDVLKEIKDAAATEYAVNLNVSGPVELELPAQTREEEKKFNNDLLEETKKASSTGYTVNWNISGPVEVESTPADIVSEKMNIGQIDMLRRLYDYLVEQDMLRSGNSTREQIMNDVDTWKQDNMSFIEKFGIKNDWIERVFEAMFNGFENPYDNRSSRPGGWRIAGIPQENGYGGLYVSPGATSAAEPENTTKAVAEGTKQGTADVTTALSSVQALLRMILNATNNKMVVVPTSALGKAVSVGTSMYGAVTGEEQ